MQIQLVIPRPPIAHRGTVLHKSHQTYKFPLHWTDQHPDSHYGIGVLLDSEEKVLDGFMFRYLRDKLGAWIDTDEPSRIANSLGVPWQSDWHEDGIGVSPKYKPDARDIDAGHLPSI